MCQRPEHTYTQTKKIYRWKITMWKDAQCHTSFESCKLKQDTTVKVLEWQKSETLTTNGDKDVEQKELSFIADETVN